MRRAAVVLLSTTVAVLAPDPAAGQAVSPGWGVELLGSTLPYPLANTGCHSGGLGAGVAGAFQLTHAAVGAVGAGASMQLQIDPVTCVVAPPYDHSGWITEYGEAYGRPLVALDLRAVVHPGDDLFGLSGGAGWLPIQEAGYVSGGLRVRIHRHFLTVVELRGYRVTGQRYWREWVEGDLVVNDPVGEWSSWHQAVTVRAVVEFPLSRTL